MRIERYWRETFVGAGVVWGRVGTLVVARVGVSAPRPWQPQRPICHPTTPPATTFLASRPHHLAIVAKKGMIRAYEERSSLRGLERTCGISRNTVIAWIKKSRKAASLERNGDRA